MGWSSATKRGKITLSLNEDKVRELLKMDDVEIQDIEFDDVEITFVMEGRTFYEPAVMYLSNGDPGYPEEYDEEFPFDEGDEGLIEISLGGLFTATIATDDPEPKDYDYED